MSLCGGGWIGKDVRVVVAALSRDGGGRDLDGMEMTMKVVKSALLAAAVGLVGMPAVADTSGRNASPVAAQPATPTAVSRMQAAMVLADLGRELKDPLQLVAAARALLAVGEGDPTGTAGGEGAVAAGGKPASGPATKPETATAASTAEGLLQEARRLARGNEAMLALIAASETGASRGSTKGPGTYRVRLQAQRYYDIAERFRGRELAEVLVRGDGDTDVDLHVYDQNGNLMCSSTAGSDREYCRWTPAWTGAFTIRVENLGSVYNDIRVTTN